MAFAPLMTRVTYHQPYGNNLPHVTLEDCKYYGYPNFLGVPRPPLNVAKRAITVFIPNEEADQMRAIGYPVNSPLLSDEEKAKGMEPISFMNVKLYFSIDKTPGQPLEEQKYPDLWVIQGDNREKLNHKTVGILEKPANFEQIDMEVRAWESRRETHPGTYTAALVQLVAVMRTNLLSEKYGNLM